MRNSVASLFPWAALLFLRADFTRSLVITTPAQEPFERAQGASVRLPCVYELAPSDTGSLIIEWILLPKDNLQKDQPIWMYSDGVLHPRHTELSSRSHFSAGDPSKGDATLEITGLKLTDTGSYQCKVMKPPDSDNKKLLLTVSEKPGNMRCYVEGIPEIGSDFKLKCESKEGALPLLYKWEKMTGTKKLPATATSLEHGVILVKNASEENSGTYKCTSENRVGSDSCLLVLNVAYPSNVAGTIAGVLIGTLLGLLLLGLIIFCCCRKQKEKKYEKEVQHEIREDVAPPKSRTSTARSFIGSNHSSLGSLSPSNMDGFAKSQYNNIPSDEFEHPPSHAPNYSTPTSKYNTLPTSAIKNGITVV